MGSPTSPIGLFGGAALASALSRSPTRSGVAMALGCCALLGVASASAQDVAAPSADSASTDHAVRYHSTVDPLVAGGLLTGFVVSEFALKAVLSPLKCRWCEPPAFDRAVRDALLWDNQQTADTLSYVTAGAEPVFAIGAVTLFGRPGERWQNAVIVAESVGAVGLFTNVVKFGVGRQRPAVHFQSSRASDIPADDANLSFFSGHSSLAFACAVSAGTVASQRGYAEAPWIWGIGLAGAAATGWLRIGADAHYATDVLTGALVGSAGGVLVPLLLHPRLHQAQQAPAAATLAMAAPTPGGGVLGLSGVW
jgi:membrane-associated phospholipid phosphatase